ncbi:MAG TPA: DoxX family protein [Usitatibacter sp.]|nr:DoxX family protein [Usitatibacter sp.]
METLSPFMAAWHPRVLALLRIVTGYLFIYHGTAKHLRLPHLPMFDNLQAWSLPWYAGWLELIGGALIIVGLFTRPTAFVLSGTMAFAYFIGHGSKGNVLVPLLNGGELAVLYCFLFLFLSVAGAGAWSVDGLMARRRAR